MKMRAREKWVSKEDKGSKGSMREHDAGAQDTRYSPSTAHNSSLKTSHY
jgi:hypothetical protein